jgi:catechol 2,3-dioxygenase-like lactoylglutathione lyase family enzyme
MLSSARNGKHTIKEFMKRTWTIIGVANVPQSFKWYQSLLGLSETAPTHDYFGQIVDSDGTVLLCLHEWGAHAHPTLESPRFAKPGNGFLLFFRIDNFDVALARARARQPVGRRATCESQHWNCGVFAPRPRWVLCHHQCARSALIATGSCARAIFYCSPPARAST